MSERPPDLSLVVACFEEEAVLPALFPEVERLAALAAARGLRIEVVFVDDGSRDSTAELVASFCEGSPDRRVLTHAGNRGFGAAMRTGFLAARGAVLVSYDSDGTYPIEDVLKLLDALRDADVAGASPFAEPGRVHAGPVRQAFSRGAAGLYRLALRNRARDITVFTCGFRAYRAECLEGLCWESDGFTAAAEVLVRLLLRGARVVEVPSTLSARAAGHSKMRVGRATAAHLSLVVRAALRRGAFRSSRGPARRSPRTPREGLPAWNRRLNREWPMERIEEHPRRAIRAVEERRRAAVLGLLDAREGERVLDVGSGGGVYSRRAGKSGARPVALDIDAEVLRGRCEPAVAAAAEALPFRGRAFSRVVLAEVLEHCPDPARALAEAMRVLSSGGRLALSVPDDRRIVGVKRFLRRLGLRSLFAGLPADRAPGHLHEFDGPGLRRLLEDAGTVLEFRRDLAALAFLAALTPRRESA